MAAAHREAKGLAWTLVWLWPEDTWIDLRYREEIHSFNVFFFFLPLICSMAALGLGNTAVTIATLPYGAFKQIISVKRAIPGGED